MWSLAGYAATQVIRLASSLVVTRLLMPEAYGLYTLVTTYLVGIIMLSDLGLGAYLFQSAKAHDQSFADSIWTLAVVRGVIVWLMGLALAWPMARFYEQPSLIPLLAVASLGLLISTLQSTKLTLAARDLKQKELALFQTLAFGNGMAIQIVLAWCFRSVWVLVIGNLIGETIRVAASQFLFPGERNHWRWDPALARELGGFSKWVYVSSAMSFLGSQADRLILGKAMPIEFLGLYGIAMNFAMLPLLLVQQGTNLLSPMVVQLRHRNDPAIQEKLQRARFVLLGAGAIAVGLMGIGAPAFYGFLYDPRYHRAGTIAAMLIANVWANLLAASVGGVLMAFGDARSTAQVSMARLVGAALGMGLGYWAGGQYGLIVGTAGAGLAAYVVACLALRRWGISVGWSDLPFSLGCLLYLATGWVVIAILHGALGGIPSRWASMWAVLILCIPATFGKRSPVLRMFAWRKERVGSRAIGPSACERCAAR